MKCKYISKKSMGQKRFNILNSFPSAGPNASITGMKKLYWGENAYIVKSGNYIYKVNASFYYSI